MTVIALMAVGALTTVGCSVISTAINGPDPAKYFDGPTSQMLRSAQDGDLEGVRRHLAAGADIHAIGNDHDPRRTGLLPLHWAAEFGSPRAVATLIDAGADPRRESSAYNAPDYALLRDRTDTLEVMLDKDPTLVDVSARGGGTILRTAVLHGRDDAVDLLIDRGADLDAADANGSTALFTAASVQNVDLCLRLIRAGADGGVRDSFGNTFLSSLYQADDDIRTRKFLRARSALEDELRQRGFPVETGR